jgi:ATP-dependent protease ClpP protease subunit
MKQLLCLLLLLPALAFSETKPKTLVLEENNTISFNNAFTSRYVAKKQVEAMTLCSKNPNSEINLVLHTPGGSVTAGKRFFDTLRALPCKFNTITIFAASMGYQTVQNLGSRYIIPSGVLMSHRAFVRGIGGEIGGELDSIIKHIKDDVNELDTIAAKRIGQSLQDYKASIADELWMTSSVAKEGNHIDEVVLVKCGISLSGTRLESVVNLFGRFDVEFSKCPLVTAPLRVLRGYGNANYSAFLQMFESPMPLVREIFNYYNNVKR